MSDAAASAPAKSRGKKRRIVLLVVVCICAVTGGMGYLRFLHSTAEKQEVARAYEKMVALASDYESATSPAAQSTISLELSRLTLGSDVWVKGGPAPLVPYIKPRFDPRRDIVIEEEKATIHTKRGTLPYINYGFEKQDGQWLYAGTDFPEDETPWLTRAGKWLWRKVTFWK